MARGYNSRGRARGNVCIFASVSGVARGDDLAQQIRRLVEQELTRRGVRDPIRVEGDSLVLGRRNEEVRAEIQGTILQWDSLPDDLRERRVQQIAELLTPGAPKAERRSTPKQSPSQRSRASVLAPLGVALLTVASIALAYRYLAPGGGGFSHWGAAPVPSASAGALADPDRERATLAGTACEQVRARVGRGANIGPADVEGWVVELVLLRGGASVDLSALPVLAKFIERQPSARRGKLIWPTAAHLAAAQRFDAEVLVSALPELGDSHLSGLSLVFSGPYVVPYFTEDQRADYFMLADALTEHLGATDGALFARCSNAEAHHVGSWFLGASPGAAVASMVYFMANFSEVPLLKPDVLGAGTGLAQHGHAFDAIATAASGMDRSAAATLIGRELGMISGRPDHPTRLTFPFRDANRATRASLMAARALSLANSG